jgi:hypothetical protein
MPRRSSKKPNANEIYTACDALVTGTGGVVRVGDRLPGDHPLLLATWGESGELWAPDGTDDAELGRRRVALATAGEEAARASIEYETPEPPRRVRDEDALVATRDAGAAAPGEMAADDGTPLRVPAGTRVRKDHPAVKLDPDAFVQVKPKGLKREDALVATASQAMQLEDGTVRRLFAGQWVRADDAFCLVNPLSFRLPDPEL